MKLEETELVFTAAKSNPSIKFDSCSRDYRTDFNSLFISIISSHVNELLSGNERNFEILRVLF